MQKCANDDEASTVTRPPLLFPFSIFHLPSSNETFPQSHRLSGRKAFAAVYAGKYRQSRGPLLVYSTVNPLGHGRLGLSVSRKVGTAPQRNRIKRLLRDALPADADAPGSGGRLADRREAARGDDAGEIPDRTVGPEGAAWRTVTAWIFGVDLKSNFCANGIRA